MERLLLALVVVATLLLPSTARADDLATARTFIAKQVEQIKAGDVAALKAGFSKRQQPRVTADNVKKAAAQVAKLTLEELVASAAPEDKGTIKIKMKNGRSLTTLIQEDGHWVADTIWYR